MASSPKRTGLITCAFSGVGTVYHVHRFTRRGVVNSPIGRTQRSTWFIRSVAINFVEVLRATALRSGIRGTPMA